jgi:hypothetical protein
MSRTISAPAAPQFLPGRAVRLTAARAEYFLHELAGTGNVCEAARRSRTPRASLYRGRGRDARFAAAWDAAMQRASESVERQNCYRGEQIGDLGPASFRLLVALLRAHRGETHDPDPVKLGPPPGEAAATGGGIVDDLIRWL